MRYECVSPVFLWSSSQTPCWEHWRCSPERSNKACSSGCMCVWGVCVRHLRIPVPSPHEGLQSHSLWKRKIIHWSVEWFFRWSVNHLINEQPFTPMNYPVILFIWCACWNSILPSVTECSGLLKTVDIAAEGKPNFSTFRKVPHSYLSSLIHLTKHFMYICTF